MHSRSVSGLQIVSLLLWVIVLYRGYIVSLVAQTTRLVHRAPWSMWYVPGTTNSLTVAPRLSVLLFTVPGTVVLGQSVHHLVMSFQLGYRISFCSATIIVQII